MENTEDTKKKTIDDYIDLAFDYVVKIVGLSYFSSNECRISKKSLCFISYSSTLVILFTAGSLYFPSATFAGINDNYDRLIAMIYVFSNYFLLYFTYFSHMLNERIYWKIRHDTENIADYRLSRKRIAYFCIHFVCAFNLIGYVYWMYPIFSNNQYPKTFIDIFKVSIRYFPGIFGTVASFKTALLFCRIERQYIIINDSYKYFNANAYFISEYKLVIGSEESIDEIRLRLFKKYKATHLALGEMVNTVNVHFTLALFIDIVRAFIVVYFGSYWVVRIVHEKGIKAVEWRYFSILQQIVKIVTLSSVCSGIEYEFNRSKRKLDAIIEDCVQDDITEEAISLADKLWLEVYVSAGGMFTINYNLLLEMAGALVKNFVVFVQLRFPDLLKI